MQETQGAGYGESFCFHFSETVYPHLHLFTNQLLKPAPLGFLWRLHYLGHSKVHNSAAFSTFTMSCLHPLRLVPKYMPPLQGALVPPEYLLSNPNPLASHLKVQPYT